MRLNKLEPSPRVQGRWLCHMEDGTLLRVTENEVVAFALYSGMELSPEEREALTGAARLAQLKARAVNLLSNRPMSRRELLKKLMEKDKDVAEDEAEAAADYLTRLGLLDDEAYAHTVVRHYSDKGYGDYKIRDELYRRGVPKALWDGAMAELGDSQAPIDKLIAQKLKGCSPDRKELKKAADALARRGYRWEEISAGLRRYGAQPEDEGNAGATD